MFSRNKIIVKTFQTPYVQSQFSEDFIYTRLIIIQVVQEAYNDDNLYTMQTFVVQDKI